MLRKLLENIVQKKNPNFELDDAVSLRALLHLSSTKLTWLLRAIFKQLWHLKKPSLVFIARNVRLFNASNIRLGKWVQLEEGVVLSALGREPLILGNRVKIGAYSRIIISTTFNEVGKGIHIGDNVGLGEFAYLGGAGGLSIGADCIIGQYLSCHPENHHFSDPNQLIRLQGTSRKGIKIGENCWIGARVTLLDGVTVGNNCVIAAGAVLTKSFPDNCVIGGVPAKIIKQTISSQSKTPAYV